MSQKLLEQFNCLKSVQPDFAWKERTRDFLVKRVKLDTVAHQTNWFEIFHTFSIVFFAKYMPSPARITAIIVVISIIGGANMIAQAEYAPNRMFYGVKRAYEKVEFVFAVTPESEAKMHLKHANERQKEATKIAASQQTSQEKASNLKTVIKSFEQNIEAAKSSLVIVKEQTENMKNSDIINEKTLNLAKEISENVSEAIKNLDEVNNITSNKDVSKTVEEAQSVAEGVNTASLKVLIEKTGTSTDPVLQKQLKNFIFQKLNRDQETINKIKVLTEQWLEAEDAAQKIDQAQKLTKEAKNLLEENAFLEAMQKAEYVSDIARELNNKINTEAEDNKAIENNQGNSATQTPKVIINPQ